MNSKHFYAAWTGYRGDQISDPLPESGAIPSPLAVRSITGPVVYDYRPERAKTIYWFYDDDNEGMYLAEEDSSNLTLIRERRKGYPYIGRISYSAAKVLAAACNWTAGAAPSDF